MRLIIALIVVAVIIISGGTALFTGKLPSFLFGSETNIQERGARLIGCLLLMPLPCSLFVDLGLLLVYEEVVVGWLIIVDAMIIFATLLIALALVRLNLVR